MKVEILMVILAIVIALLVFLLICKVVNWCCRMNIRISLMKKQNLLLENLLTVLKNKHDHSENETTTKEDKSIE